jgi:hypothetical protein
MVATSKSLGSFGIAVFGGERAGREAESNIQNPRKKIWEAVSPAPSFLLFSALFLFFCFFFSYSSVLRKTSLRSWFSTDNVVG